MSYNLKMCENKWELWVQETIQFFYNIFISATYQIPADSLLVYLLSTFSWSQLSQIIYDGPYTNKTNQQNLETGSVCLLISIFFLLSG